MSNFASMPSESAVAMPPKLEPYMVLAVKIVSGDAKKVRG